MLSCSLPSSSPSSPRHKSGSLNKGKSDWRPPSSTKPPDTSTTLATHPPQHLQFTRSKSCGEGRASTPSIDDDLQLCSRKGTPPIKPVPKRITTVNKNHGFTCGALCVYLPTFSKPKADKRPPPQNEVKEAATTAPDPDYDSFFSKRVSLAKFEWGSRSSAAIICKDDKESNTDLTQSLDYYKDDEDEEEEEDHEDSTNLYFDLPLELMRYAANDSPDKAAFIFTAYQGHEKTFDKTNSSDPLLSSSAKYLNTDTTQQVRFSTE